jgi:hypothetical protein
MSLVLAYQVNNFNLYFKSFKITESEGKINFKINFTVDKECSEKFLKRQFYYYTWIFEEFKEQLLTVCRAEIKNIEHYNPEFEIRTEKLMFLCEL